MFTVKQRLSAMQLAEWQNVKVGTIYNLLSQARSKTNLPANPIPFHMFGGSPRFDFDEINEWTKSERRRKASQQTCNLPVRVRGDETSNPNEWDEAMKTSRNTK